MRWKVLNGEHGWNGVETKAEADAREYEEAGTNHRPGQGDHQTAGTRGSAQTLINTALSSLPDVER